MNEPTPLNRHQAPAGPFPTPTTRWDFLDDPHGTLRRRQQMEAMMRDEIYDREYQAGRDALHDGIDRLLAGIGQTFRVMNEIQFSSPWARGGSRRPAGT